MPIYRSMLADRDDLPIVGRSANKLGVRLAPDPIEDIPVEEGMVRPRTGGMSVVRDPTQMHPQRRPSFLPEGKNTLPLFQLHELDLPRDLALRTTGKGTHMVVEPGRDMPIEEYESLLGGTRGGWRRILGP